MRPETGNNHPSADVIKVSVRVDSGGHSFSVDTLPKRASDKKTTVEFVIVTDKTVLVPSDIFSNQDAEALLAAAGVPCNSDEQPLCISAGEMTAVAAVSKRCAELIAGRFGGRAVFASPLLEEFASDGRKLHIRTFGSTACFKLYEDGRLRFAEMLKTAGEDDVLYYVQGLHDHFALDAYHIYIYGDRSAETAKLLKRYFNNVECE